MTTTVVALGGNALLRRGEPLDPAIQDRNVASAASAILAAVSADEQLVITHGNGPQVGLLALADAGRDGDLPFPLDILDAESEGMIGYLLARHLHRAGGRPVVSLLTQVVVDPADPAFARPTKAIGPVYSADQAQDLAARRGWQVAPEPASSGTPVWRRVVASPRPHRIVELDSIRHLLAAGTIVVCAGGGGVPVAVDDRSHGEGDGASDGAIGGRLVGVEAVVDKDATSALLAEHLGADRLVLVTDVEAVVAGWGTPAAHPITRATSGELAAGDFAAGSMGPKVQAACTFVDHTGHRAAIGSLDRLPDVLAGRSGTWIEPVGTAAPA
jgi:carbamate kinase